MRLRVCKLVDVPPSGLHEFEVEGLTNSVLIGYIGGDLIAATSVCPHEDVSIAEGVLDAVAGSITCKAHGYCFDLRTGECEHSSELQLRRFNVSISMGDVFIDLLRSPA